MEVFARSSGGEWGHSVYSSGDVVELPSLSLAFSADELYDAAGLTVR